MIAGDDHARLHLYHNKDFSMRRIFLEAFSSLLVLLFVYAAISKLLDYQRFAIQIGQSPLLNGLSGFIGPFVIAIELVIAIGLSMMRFRLLSFYAAFSLMVMFTTYIIAVMKLSPYVPCSCGGILEKMDWNDHLIFNVSVSVVCGIAIVLQSRDFGLRPSFKS